MSATVGARLGIQVGTILGSIVIALGGLIHLASTARLGDSAGAGELYAGYYSPWYDPWYGPSWGWGGGYWGGHWGHHHHYYPGYYSTPSRHYSNGRSSYRDNRSYASGRGSGYTGGRSSGSSSLRNSGSTTRLRLQVP